ncbi:MAG: hypothetical protein JWN71_2236 [Xanthobacteraceae bacterium]|nr:hypothetical protein [Xanthobacteraceae bacterium]
MERYEALFPVLPDYVAHYTVGGKYTPRIGLPNKQALGLTKKILAAIISSQTGIAATYAEKRYGSDPTESRWLGLTDRIDDLFNYGQKRLNSYISAGMEMPKKKGSYQDLSMQFFYRNLAAFDASKRLAELGYLCEVAAILRAALEQFAFSAHLWNCSGEEYLKKLRPLHAIGPFKQSVPASGELYGLLSKYIHFEYDHHTHFFAFSESEIFTVQRGAVLRSYATHLLFVTMCCVAKYVIQAAPKQFEQAPTTTSELEIFLKQTESYFQTVSAALSQDRVLDRLHVLLRRLLS